MSASGIKEHEGNVSFSPRMAAHSEPINSCLCPSIVQRPREGQSPAQGHTVSKWRMESQTHMPCLLAWDSFQEEILEDEPHQMDVTCTNTRQGTNPMTQTCKPKGPGQCHPGTFLPSQVVPQSRVPGRAAPVRTKGDSYVEGTWREDILLRFASLMHAVPASETRGDG